MKLILAGIVAAGLFAGLFVLPISGHTLWQRAQARGLPQSAARAMSRGAHAAVRWAEEKRAQSNAAAAANSNAGAHKPADKKVARAAPDSQHNPADEARSRELPAAPGAVERDPAAGGNSPSRPPRVASAAPSRAHDHIVAAPPEETLTHRDRQGLDKLIAGQGRDR